MWTVLSQPYTTCTSRWIVKHLFWNSPLWHCNDLPGVTSLPSPYDDVLITFHGILKINPDDKMAPKQKNIISIHMKCEIFTKAWWVDTDRNTHLHTSNPLVSWGSVGARLHRVKGRDHTPDWTPVRHKANDSDIYNIIQQRYKNWGKITYEEIKS